mgnify:CR=1 FL=1
MYQSQHFSIQALKCLADRYLFPRLLDPKLPLKVRDVFVALLFGAPLYFVVDPPIPIVSFRLAALHEILRSFAFMLSAFWS